MSTKFDICLSADISIISIIHNDLNFLSQINNLKEETIDSIYFVGKYILASLSFDQDKIKINKNLEQKIKDIADDSSYDDEEKVEKLDNLFNNHGFFIPTKIEIGGQFIIDIFH